MQLGKETFINFSARLKNRDKFSTERVSLNGKEEGVALALALWINPLNPKPWNYIYFYSRLSSTGHLTTLSFSFFFCKMKQIKTSSWIGHLVTGLKGLSWFSSSFGNGKLSHTWPLYAASSLPRLPLQGECNFMACSRFTAGPSPTDSRPTATQNEKDRQ